MNAYFKTLLRSIKNNFGRFMAITVIIVLGIAFISGLGTLAYKVEASLDEYLVQQNVADLIIKAPFQNGLTSKQINSIKSHAKVKNTLAISASDIKENDINKRIYIMPLANNTVNKLEVLSGTLPLNGDQVAVERKSNFVDELAIGDTVEFMGMTKTISGIVGNPLLTYADKEPSQTNGETLRQIIYYDAQYLDTPLPITDIYVELDVPKDSFFGDKYKDAVTAEAKSIKGIFGNAALFTLSLQQNLGVAIADNYCGKINVIAFIFPAFFIAVAALVVLTTMTRMVEEDRSSIGCYKTLGYSDAKVAFKYVGFSALSCIIGCGLGLALGVTILPMVIFPAFKILFHMPPMAAPVNLGLGLIATAIMLISLIGVTFYLIKKELSCQPAALLRPKAPKAGKKIFLEYVPIVWNRFSFKYKSTLRNIFRYKKHLIMTVISVAGSTALVLAGFGLLDIAGTDTGGDMQVMAGSFSMISGVVIAFAVLLCIMVIYNLTNMNIGERRREIATLDVLGYRQFEVAGYIYREILIMAIFGILIGLPLGFGLLYFVFHFLDFGSVYDVNWYSYLLTAALVIAVIFVVDLMLWYKIKKIDMTSSLKTVE